MDDKDKAALAAVNAEAEKVADRLFGYAMSKGWSFALLLGYGLVCAFIGGWIRVKFGC